MKATVLPFDKFHYLRIAQLTQRSNQFNLQKGEIVLVTSDLTALMLLTRDYEEPIMPDILIDYLQMAVGNDGTLLFPTYNWDYCKGITFNYNSTRCKTGALGVAALKRSDFIRTRHPIYSFAVWGKDSKKLYEMDNISSFGSDSPFAYLHENNAKNIIIDVSYQNCFTFAHYVEECCMEYVPYRYLKTFNGGSIVMKMGM
jgi:aminoglycoside 3-N-acetyltransferase